MHKHENNSSVISYYGLSSFTHLFSYIFLAHLAQTENEVFFLVTVSHSIGARHLWHMQGDHEGDTHTPRSRALSEACTPKLAHHY